MKTPAMILGNDFISITLNNKPYTIYKGDARFDNILSIIKRKEWEMLEAAFDTAKTVSKLTDGNISIYEDTVTYKNQPTHNAVASKILEFMKGGYPFQPLVKFLNKLMDNPSHKSVEALYHYIEFYKLPIAEDGDFHAYKAVRSDFLDKYTGTIDNSLGKIVEIPRNQCSDDTNVNCSVGLHIGSFTSYIQSFANDTDNIIIVKVNPRDVVSLPNDTSCAKMRVCRYEVIEVVGTKDKVKEFDKAYIAPKDENDVHDYAFDEQVTDAGLNPDNEDNGNGFGAESTAEPFGVQITVASSKNQIGANKAYELHKAGKLVERHVVAGGVYMTYPHDKKSRSFFRQYTGWKASTRAVNPEISVSADRAYQLHKNGLTVENKKSGIVFPSPAPNRSRDFFRSQNGWKKVN